MARATYGRFVAHGPWVFRSPAAGRLWIVRVAEGSAVIASGVHAVTAAAGDYVVARDEAGVLLADGPGRTGNSCATATASAVHGLVRAGSTGPITDLRAMTLAHSAEGYAPPAAALLPAVLRLRPDSGTAAALEATFALLEHEREYTQECGRDGLADATMTCRLADVLAAHTLRALATTTGAGALTALLDEPHLGRAARAMHDDLARPWTVATLAREAHMSRAAFAAAFRDATGDTPLAMLRQWRVCQAKRHLRETSLTVGEIALRVGYESAPALTRAFTRRERVSPGEYRRRTRAGARDGSSRRG